MAKKYFDEEPIIPQSEEDSKLITIKLTTAFFCCICAILIMYIGYLWGTCTKMHGNTAKIIETFETHMSHNDSVFLQAYNAETAMVSQCTHIIDSISELKKDKRTSALLADLTQEYVRLNHQVTRDSISISRERLLIEQELKTLVAIHLDKIDNDYTVITIWSSVLTIIFLIFSFYSIFKIEETKREVNRTYLFYKSESESSLSKLKKSVNKEKTDIESKSKQLQEAINNMDSNSASIIDAKRGEIEQLLTQYRESLNNELDKMKSSYTTFQESCMTQLEQKLKEMYDADKEKHEQTPETEE